MRPVICLITDRRRFGQDWERVLPSRVRAAALAGVHLIQIRERDLDGGQLSRLTRECLEAVRGTRTRVIVNDRLDVAITTGAHGVHLRGDSMPSPRARSLAPVGFLIGRSVHTVEEALYEGIGALDYFLFGTVFETTSKPGQQPAGVERLAAVSQATTRPVLAVGGITPQRATAVARAGAVGVAAIGLFANGSLDAMRTIVGELSSAFDTLGGVP